MGGLFSYPESMAHLPDTLDKQTVHMYYDNRTYIITPRSFWNQVGRHALINTVTPESLTELAQAVGNGHFIVNLYDKQQNTLTQVLTTADSTHLKPFLKLFAIEKGIDLSKASFELKDTTNDVPASATGGAKKTRKTNVSTQKQKQTKQDKQTKPKVTHKKTKSSKT